MTRWEYRFVEVFANPEMGSEQLTSLGYEGWEGVGMHVDAATRASETSPYHMVVLMKRPRPSESDGGTVKTTGP